ncbi:TetR/AcrR family transcriptional regulator [Sandaracinobacter neustonicus]|uniref:TetR/AcrR family transcriptional regulator n=1 Tax=Sandaracinobacter neustonicus TaxID=1715348 RepID=A0A501XM03_9SPHN|nr:TetR/AcrR family transcriptional regulator [Sandaracinobacter neustonicus]TPE61586.1 TetR/AcrR family transcriptional regulator [Sandaracinobacter neustonicus]
MTEQRQTRDRARTEATILAAAEVQLAQTGFKGFGVNAVARAAGCDKQLIYRYFGGAEGLADAIGRQIATRATDTPATSPATYLDFVEQTLLNYLESFRRDPLARQIAAWELADNSPLIERLATARNAALMRQLEANPQLQPPLGIDGPAINALLLGAIQQMVLSASQRGHFAAVPLNEDRNWIRIRLALRTLIRGAYRVGRAAEGEGR